MHQYYVYILTNFTHSTLYIGVTNNLERRLLEHKKGLVQGFTKQYNTHKLVYCEEGGDITAAIEREKQIKKWNRKKKEFLIETLNPEWNDLAEDWFE